MANSAFAQWLSRRGVKIAAAGRRVVIVDVENIERSARDAGIALNVPGLTSMLTARVARDLCAVLTSHAGTARLESAFAQAGWQVVGGHAQTSDGRANADLSIATVASMLTAGCRASDEFVLLTGDGELGCAVAEAVRLVSDNSPSIIIGSFRHALSRRLWPENNVDIAGVLELYARQRRAQVAWRTALRGSNHRSWNGDVQWSISI